jgi:hypothetical protein
MAFLKNCADFTIAQKVDTYFASVSDRGSFYGSNSALSLAVNGRSRDFIPCLLQSHQVLSLVTMQPHALHVHQPAKRSAGLSGGSVSRHCGCERIFALSSRVNRGRIELSS